MATNAICPSAGNTFKYCLEAGRAQLGMQSRLPLAFACISFAILGEYNCRFPVSYMRRSPAGLGVLHNATTTGFSTIVS